MSSILHIGIPIRAGDEHYFPACAASLMLQDYAKGGVDNYPTVHIFDNGCYPVTRNPWWSSIISMLSSKYRVLYEFDASDRFQSFVEKRQYMMQTANCIYYLSLDSDVVLQDSYTIQYALDCLHNDSETGFVAGFLSDVDATSVSKEEGRPVDWKFQPFPESLLPEDVPLQTEHLCFPYRSTPNSHSYTARHVMLGLALFKNEALRSVNYFSHFLKKRKEWSEYPVSFAEEQALGIALSEIGWKGVARTSFAGFHCGVERNTWGNDTKRFVSAAFDQGFTGEKKHVSE